MKAFLRELKRRHVYRVAVVYIVISWLVLQVGDIVLGIFDTPAWVMKALLALLVLGFPLAVVLAWAFELTSTGVRRTEPLDSPEARAPEDRRRVGHGLNIALGTALVVALAVIGWQLLSRPAAHDTARDTQTMADAGMPKAHDERKSIAVLPLANGSGDPAQEYFSDGLSEELIAGLSRIEGLTVIGRTSSFQFKGTTDSASIIGEKLGVGHLLEGSVRQQVERVRITVALVRANDGSTLWTQTFDRKLDDIFAVQSEIAQAVAAALQVALTPSASDPRTSDQPPSGNVAAYQAYLQGRMYGRRQDEAGFRTSIRFHREALQLDPDYPSARLGLVISLVNLAYGQPLEESLGLDKEARDIVAEAKKKSPDHLYTHLAESYVLNALDNDVEGAMAAARKALALAPNHTDTLAMMGAILGTQNRWEESVDYLRRALATDPMRLRWHANIAHPLIVLGRLDEAEASIRRVLETDPRFPLMHSLLADIAATRGDAVAVREAAADAPDPDSRRYALALAHAVEQDQAGLDAALRDIIGDCTQQLMDCLYAAASVSGFARQPDRAFEFLDRAAEDPRFRPDTSDPFLAPYHHDPRFIALLDRYGMSLPSPISEPAKAH
ncbi:MAG: tetratricopeptide repeat protein [Luteimonas sp.]|nr:tetratricopeptide repeat protein [Luteimonas sp.]